MNWSRREGCHTLIIANRGDEMIGDGVWDLDGLLFSGRVGRFINELRTLTAGQGLRRFLGELYGRLVVEPAFLHFGPRGWEYARRLFYGPQKWFTLPEHLPARWHQQDLTDIIYESEPQPLPRPTGPGTGSIVRWRRLRNAATARLAEIYERHGSMSGIEVTDPWADRRVAEFVLKLPQWAVESPRRPKRLASVLATGRCPLGTSPKINFFIGGVPWPSSGRHADVLKELATLRELAARDLCRPDIFKEELEQQVRDLGGRHYKSYIFDAEYWLRCWAPMANTS